MRKPQVSPMPPRALPLAALIAVALALVPTSASARSPFADESRRAFSLSTGPFFGFGAVVAPLGVESGGAFTLGARFGGQPTWYSGIYVEGGAVLATSGQTVATILPFEKPALNGTYPFFSLLGALRPGSWWSSLGGLALQCSEVCSPVRWGG